MNMKSVLIYVAIFAAGVALAERVRSTVPGASNLKF